jgi:hypothetical protein
MCGLYDSHKGVFGDDFTWRGIFLALWSIFD